MKLLAMTILLALFCAAPAFAQSVKSPVTSNGLRPNHSAVAAPRNTWTKRLRGESTVSIAASTPISTYIDSIQYFYDAQNRLAESLNRSFVNNNWVIQSRTQYLEYDSSGHVLLETVESTPDNGLSWDLKRRTTTTYYAQGYYLIWVQEWSGGDFTSHFYEYDPQGNLYGEFGGAFFYDYTNSYNQDGFLESILKLHYFNSYAIYVWYKQFLYDSLHPGRLVTAMTYDYNAWNNGEYALVDSIAYTYDPSGNLLTSDHFEFDYPFDCQPIYRQIQFFNAQNHLSRQENLEMCQVVDSISDWKLSAATNYVYDADGDPRSWSRQEYSEADTVLFFHQYTYETVSRVQEQPSGVDFALYPNPASDAIFLKTAPGSVQWAKIFDSTGRLLHSQRLEGSEIETVSVAGIPDGQYVVQVIGQDGKMTAKPFIVVH